MVPRRGPFLTRTTKRRLGSSRATSLDVCNRGSGSEDRRIRGCTYTPETDFSEHRCVIHRYPKVSAPFLASGSAGRPELFVPTRGGPPAPTPPRPPGTHRKLHFSLIWP